MQTVPDTIESAGHFSSGLAPCAQAAPASSTSAAGTAIPRTARLITRLSFRTSRVSQARPLARSPPFSPSDVVAPPPRRAFAERQRATVRERYLRGSGVLPRTGETRGLSPSKALQRLRRGVASIPCTGSPL